MRRLERRQIIIGLALAAAFSGVLLVLGQAHYVPTYLSAVAAVWAIWWFLTDIAAPIEPVSWDLASAPSRRTPRGDDERATRLSNRLTDLGATHSDPAVVYQLLVGIIDDRLLAHHGIDRSRDGDAASALGPAPLSPMPLSPTLGDFVKRQPATRDLHNANYLSRLISEIEEL
jgi:hypothetical protein